MQIYINRREGNGVYLLIKVKENHRMDHVQISGNDDLTEGDITKKINLIKGQIITPEDLAEVVRILKHEYDSDGYLNAVINTSLVPASDSSNRVIVKLDIDEGQKVKVDHIYFHGNKHFDDGDLKGEMKETNERTWWKFWQTNKFDKKKYADDKDLIVAYYQKKRLPGRAGSSRFDSI